MEELVKGLVAWFAQNGVVANLVMVVIVVVGLMTIPTLKKEVFPEFSIGMISVSVSYLILKKIICSCVYLSK